MTLLDEARKNQEIAKEREINLKALNDKLIDARALKSLLSENIEIGTFQESQIVQNEINRLEKFIQSEKEALNEVATDDDVQDVLKQMSF